MHHSDTLCHILFVSSFNKNWDCLFSCLHFSTRLCKSLVRMTVTSNTVLVKVMAKLWPYKEFRAITFSKWVSPSNAKCCPFSASSGTMLTSTGCQPLATRTWMPIWQNSHGCTWTSSTPWALLVRYTPTWGNTLKRYVILRLSPHFFHLCYLRSSTI